MRILYNVGLLFALFSHVPRLLRRRGRAGLGLAERLGRYPDALAAGLRGKNPLWLHSVSVGEAVVGSILLSRLLARRPGLPVLVSTVTGTGQKVARERIFQADAYIYFPLDFRGPVTRALTAVQPRIVLLTEGEIWPNFLEACSLRKIPVLLINGRISSRSFQRYRVVKPLFRKVLNHITYFCMQGDLDAERIVTLGADSRRVVVTGNIKYDDEAPNGQLPAHLASVARLMNGRPVWVAGSTHRGEESLILQAFREVRKEASEALLVLAPRHPERIPEVETLLREAEMPFVRRSHLTDGVSEIAPVILVDTMGELGQLYSLATVAFVGGSLVPVGGHNILEPARYRRPILFGPYMDNFSEVAEAFLAEGMPHQVRDASELVARVLGFLRDPGAAQQMGEAAHRVLTRNQGAAERTVTVVERFL